MWKLKSSAAKGYLDLSPDLEASWTPLIFIYWVSFKMSQSRADYSKLALLCTPFNLMVKQIFPNKLDVTIALTNLAVASWFDRYREILRGDFLGFGNSHYTDCVIAKWWADWFVPMPTFDFMPFPGRRFFHRFVKGTMENGNLSCYIKLKSWKTRFCQMNNDFVLSGWNIH